MKKSVMRADKIAKLEPTQKGPVLPLVLFGPPNAAIRKETRMKSTKQRKKRGETDHQS